MKRLILTTTAPVLLLAACASGPEQLTVPLLDADDVPKVLATQAPPPHFPSDLTPAGVAAADDHLALEEVDGAEAMAFVQAENEKALARLTGDPRYDTYRAEALAILTSEDRIPSPSFLGDGVGNFWQDAANPKGLWRRTTLESYKSDDPAWETLLDIDALAKAEGKDWVWKGADCLAPDETRCLISLSAGGKDAVVVREFDTTTGLWVEDGFILPEGKHRIEWLDRDTLLVATDFGADKDGGPTLTESGYPFIVKSLKRGQTLDQATEVYRGERGDGGYGVSPDVLRDDEGRPIAVLIHRPLDTFRGEVWELVDGETIRLDLPRKVTVRGAMNPGESTLVKLVFTIEEPWRDYAEGALLGMPIELLRPQGVGEIVVSNAAKEIFAPGPRQSIEDVRVFDDRVVATIYDNVRGGAVVFEDNGEWGWPQTALETPENVAVHLGDSSRASGRLFYSFDGFLTPSTLNLADAASGDAETVKQAPAMFDASTHVVEQFEATSSDGTKIPYFVVRPKDLAMNGSAPTILYGYGGFQVSKPPAYIPEMGKLWLERGGVYVNANIRGGGEFGPAWHQAVLKENRQLAFDDFTAVAKDLIARDITSPDHLGIYGRSNGGVLTSVAITQHPELYDAAVIESPLIDMLRYHELPAGASWIGEYGDPRIPEEAAWIAEYSAYQQLRPDVDYPLVYITTNTRDDRVHPGHARKFAARLADMGHEHLYYEETSGGHSNDADPRLNAHRWARHYVYLAQQLMDEE